MARKRKSSLFEDLYVVTAKLPWWVGVSLAVVSYVVLRHYATTAIPQASLQRLDIGAELLRSLAVPGQYVLPAIFLMGAAGSWFGRRKRENLLTSTVKDESGTNLRAMTWQDFELLVGEAFRQRGFSVAEAGGGGPDGGVDLRLRKEGEVFLVQCKHWRAYKVSVSTVRELYGVMAAEGVAGGFVVTSGVFTADAQSFAKGRNIELIDGEQLRRFIKPTRRNEPLVASETESRTEPVVYAKAEACLEPACPRCGGAMVKRLAKQGANAGRQFWGCSRFPKCRGVLAG